MLRIRWVALSTAGTLLLTACPDEPKPEVPIADGGLTPISQPITSTTATTAQVRPPPPTPPPPTPARTCKGGPKWIGKAPCVKDGFLYGVGELPAPSDSFPNRAAAANRARKRIALALGAHENDTFKLSLSEAVQVHHCENVLYALARVPHAQKGELRTCGADELAPAPPREGCPAWVDRVAWKEGKVFYATVPMRPGKQRIAAEQIAVNRARQMVAQMLEVELQLQSGGVTATANSNRLRPKPGKVGTCNGNRWILAAFEQGVDKAAVLKQIQKSQ